MEEIRLKNILLTVAIALLISSIWHLTYTTDYKNLRHDLTELRKDLEAPKLLSVEACNRTIDRAKAQKWEFVKDRWLRVSDINDVSWYYTAANPISIKKDAWETLLREKSQDANFIISGVPPYKSYDIRVSYLMNRKDLAYILQDVNDVQPENGRKGE